MSTDRVAFGDLLRKPGIDQTALLHDALEQFLQQLMEVDVTAQMGAARYGRTETRTN
jgi:hypothetical protein